MPHRQQPRISIAEFQSLMNDAVPYVGLLNIRVEELGWGTARLVLPPSDLILRPGGTITGPAQMALADIAMYAIIMTRIGRVELAVTTNLAMNFLRRPAPSEITAHARLLKLGKRLAVGDITLTSADGPDPVAHATATYSIPPVVS